MNIPALLKSSKTTAVGLIGAIIIFLTSVLDLLNSEQVEVLVAAVVAMIGLFAKDGDKSSQDVGIRP